MKISLILNLGSEVGGKAINVTGNSEKDASIKTEIKGHLGGTVVEASNSWFGFRL